jgi:hypothetical protein
VTSDEKEERVLDAKNVLARLPRHWLEKLEQELSSVAGRLPGR